MSTLVFTVIYSHIRIYYVCGEIFLQVVNFVLPAFTRTACHLRESMKHCINNMESTPTTRQQIQNFTGETWRLATRILIPFVVVASINTLPSLAAPARIDNNNINPATGLGSTFSGELFIVNEHVCIATVLHVLQQPLLNKLSSMGVKAEVYKSSIETPTSDPIVSFCVRTDTQLNKNNLMQALSAIGRVTNTQILMLQPNALLTPPIYRSVFKDGQSVDINKLSLTNPNKQIISGVELFNPNPGRSGTLLYYQNQMVGHINGTANENTQENGRLRFLYFTWLTNQQESVTGAIVEINGKYIFASGLHFGPR